MIANFFLVILLLISSYCKSLLGPRALSTPYFVKWQHIVLQVSFDSIGCLCTDNACFTVVVSIFFKISKTHPAQPCLISTFWKFSPLSLFYSCVQTNLVNSDLLAIHAVKFWCSSYRNFVFFFFHMVQQWYIISDKKKLSFLVAISSCFVFIPHSSFLSEFVFPHGPSKPFISLIIQLFHCFFLLSSDSTLFFVSRLSYSILLCDSDQSSHPG